VREAEELGARVGVAPACRGLGVARATLYRRRAARACPRSQQPRRRPARALSDEERRGVLDVLHDDRFVDLSPREVHAALLDEGRYLCSPSTMYRILAASDEVRERRDQCRHPAHPRPELLATRPNELWSWDITKLKGPVKWTYFYLYVLLDVFSRYVVGWTVAACESAAIAKQLIEESCEKQGIEPGQLTVHADRGPAPASKSLALLYADLGVGKSHSRPYTSTDNPYSEAHFRTFKYRPDFPERFGAIQDARAHSRDFFDWYNNEHRHAGIAMLTPAMVHFGQADAVLAARQVVLDLAQRAHPERFVRGRPTPGQAPTEVWINRPLKAPERDLIAQ
jgi:putative transposase